MVSMNSFEFIPPEASNQQENNSIEFVIIPDVQVESNGDLFSADTDESIDSLTLDCTASEMSDRLKKLLDENADLKEKLIRSNKVMREQLDTISAWNEQLTNSTNKHRAMIDDLIKKNQKLQEEKDVLEKSMQDAEEKVTELSEACEEVNILKKKCSELDEELIKLKEKEDANIPAQETNCSITSLVEADNDSDYAIIVKEDFLSMKTSDELKSVLRECEQLRSQTVMLTEDLNSEKFKVRNLQKTLGEKELFYENEKEIQSLDSICVVSMHEENNRKLNVTIKELQAQIESISKQFQTEKTEHENLIQRFKELDSDFKGYREQTVASSKDLQFDVLKQMELKDHVGVLICQLDKEKEKTSKLETELNSKEEELKDLQVKYENSTAELNDLTHHVSELKEEQNIMNSELTDMQLLQEKYVDLDSQATAFKTKWEELQCLTCEKDHIIEKLKKDVEHVSEDLKESRLQNELQRKKILAAEQNFDMLSQEHDILLNRVQRQNVQHLPNDESRSSLPASERAELQNKIDSLTAQLLQTEELLQNTQIRLIQLSREIKTLDEDSKTIPVLKAQVEVLKSDLESEKSIKDVMEEKEKTLIHQINDLRTEVRSLQSHIQNEQYSGRRGHRYSSTRHGHEQPESGNTGGSFACPCCPLSFSNYQALENHVEVCLEA